MSETANSISITDLKTKAKDFAVNIVTIVTVILLFLFIFYYSIKFVKSVTGEDSKDVNNPDIKSSNEDSEIHSVNADNNYVKADPKDVSVESVSDSTNNDAKDGSS